MNSGADQELMLQVRDGDLARLGNLFERHHATLFGFFLRLTGQRQLSEDLVQEVFMRILKYRHTFREGHDFATWMYRIARNARHDYYRKGRHEMLGDADREQEPMSHEPTPAELAVRGQQIDLLRAALARLPEEKREVLVLSRFHNLKYEQIAGILACEVGTVKTRVFRALKELESIYFALSDGKAS